MSHGRPDGRDASRRHPEPEEFARLIAKDIDRLGGAVRAAGIKAQ
jgi:hypothetical protein